METENKAAESIDYETRAKEIQDFVTAVSKLLDNHESLKEMNFGLFLQHGRLGFVDLDAFAKSVDIDKMKQKITEEEKDIDNDKNI
jgi:hypothetical protein